jgi:hypothetical protein
MNRWINPAYLDPRTIEDIKQSVLAKPDIPYVVLDNFFNVEPFEELIEQHKTLQFSEEADRRTVSGSWLPYDGAVCWANKDHVGADLFFSQEWRKYCHNIVGATLTDNSTEVKLRHHRPKADGFWIHTDSNKHQLVVLCYFGKDWKAKDGGLLQFWRIAEGRAPDTPTIEAPQGRMDFLSKHKRIRTSTPGGGFPDMKPHDLILVDQIVPTWNRIVICSFENVKAYHSVTPSNGRARTGFVQWFYK